MLEIGSAPLACSGIEVCHERVFNAALKWRSWQFQKKGNPKKGGDRGSPPPTTRVHSRTTNGPVFITPSTFFFHELVSFPPSLSSPKTPIYTCRARRSSPVCTTSFPWCAMKRTRGEDPEVKPVEGAAADGSVVAKQAEASSPGTNAALAAVTRRSHCRVDSH